MKALILSLLLVGVAVSVSWSAGENDNVIQPGKQIGQVRLGAELSAVVKLLGPAARTTGGKEGRDAWFAKAKDGGPAELTEVVSKPEKSGRAVVRQVSVTSPYFHTLEGNSTRSDVAALWREFPNLHYARYGDKGDISHIQFYDDRERGVAVMIQLKPNPAAGESWGHCVAIIVHRPGERADWVDLGRLTAEKI